MEEMTEGSVKYLPSGHMEIRCTSFCGAVVTGPPRECQAAYNRHRHRVDPSTIRKAPWHESLFDNIFSFYGVMVLIVIVGGLVAIFGKNL